MSDITLEKLRERLGKIAEKTREAAREGLEKLAEGMEEAIKEELEARAGQGDHGPWERIAESLGHAAEGDEAVVGATAPEALVAEEGDLYHLPEPFLGPVLQAHEDDLAREFGKAVAEGLEKG